MQPRADSLLLDLKRLTTRDSDFGAELEKLLHWDMSEDNNVERVAREVIAEVRSRGDQALLEYTREFDRLTVASANKLELSMEDCAGALDRISADQRDALEKAAARIRVYHQHQQESSWSFEDEFGNELGQRITALDRVGVYVPGGQASYPSSVLMTLIPAKVAGVSELVVTQPTPDGVRNDMVLAALAIAGADRVFTVGGAQAIASLAYGTKTIPRVDKIVGPGGAFVAAAKRLVFGQVGIDLIAGPSEVLVIADGTTDPEWTALDLFSQAEHDAAAQAILLSSDDDFIDEVASSMEQLLSAQPRAEIIRASLEGRGALIATESIAESVEIANRIAPEHLELHIADPQSVVADVRHAGAIFCGAHASETLGDYVAGPSHVLPTFGTARFASPLGVYDFQKRSSVLNITADGAASLADIALPIAESEGLYAHARAAAVRAQEMNKSKSS
ncbi:MAG: histidinol dehydrogenase [Pseudomonadales bacterium]|nr:histidinol dehydrogenase [Pseudomonadales bacterium]